MDGEFRALDGEAFDVRIAGCGLAEAIRAASHAARGERVLVTARGRGYGRPDHMSARVPVRDGRSWYLLDGGPVMLASAGPMVDALIELGAAAYVRFEPVRGVVLVRPDGGKWLLPLSKEAVMLDASLALADKRLLMRALREGSAAALPPALAGLLHAALGGPPSDDDLGGPPSDDDLGAFVRGLGRFAPVADRCADRPAALHAPYLVPTHGASDVVQAFCRAAALRGAVFALGNPHAPPAEDGGRADGDVHVLVVDRPLDQAGCWLYRCGGASLLQVDGAAAACSADLCMYYCWGPAAADWVAALFAQDPAEPLRPHILRRHRSRALPVASLAAEREIICRARNH